MFSVPLPLSLSPGWVPLPPFSSWRLRVRTPLHSPYLYGVSGCSFGVDDNRRLSRWFHGGVWHILHGHGVPSFVPLKTTVLGNHHFFFSLNSLRLSRRPCSLRFAAFA